MPEQRLVFIKEDGEIHQQYIGAGMTSRRFDYRFTDHKGQHWFELGNSVMTFDQLRTAFATAKERIDAT